MRSLCSSSACTRLRSTAGSLERVLHNTSDSRLSADAHRRDVACNTLRIHTDKVSVHTQSNPMATSAIQLVAMIGVSCIEYGISDVAACGLRHPSNGRIGGRTAVDEFRAENAWSAYLAAITTIVYSSQSEVKIDHHGLSSCGGVSPRSIAAWRRWRSHSSRWSVFISTWISSRRVRSSVMLRS